jgi:hypothetical protein
VAFEKNVFINCPFETDFYTVLRPLLFTIIYLGLNPRIATERLDSGEARIAKIIELIQDSKYAIHDLSKIKAEKAGEFYRLNMPFELGIDVGCRLFKNGVWAEKKCLVMVAEHYKYQAAISDLSNSDVAVHKNESEEVVREVRNWLTYTCGLHTDGPSRIWDAFNEFMGDNYDELIERGFSKKDIERLPVPELITYMKRWVDQQN